MNILRLSVMKRFVAWVSLLAVPIFCWWCWPRPRAAMYALYREHVRGRSIAQLEGYHVRRSRNFQVWYTPKDEGVVDLVLNAAESVYEPVAQYVGLHPQELIPVIIYPDRDSLRAAFGWGRDQSAMGVYWSGTIRLLSPNVWISADSDEELLEIYAQINPLAHELTHYILDYLTNGNYPRWFSEGLAQWVEERVSGFLWIEPESSLHQGLYSLEDLQNRFDHLENEPLAYRQSYLLVEYLVSEYGEEQLVSLLQQLADGVNFDEALKRVVGITPDQLEADWLGWVADRLPQSEFQE